MAGYDVDVGFRFKPADQELINFFLYRKAVLRQPLLPQHVDFVHEIDFLGDNQPWEIWDACGGPQPYGNEVYFFCKLKKLSKSGIRIDRRNVSGGFWNGKQLGEDVFDRHDENPNNKRIIGRKRQFKYVNEGSELHHDWYLETYTLASIPDDDQPVVAICRLRKNYHKRKRHTPRKKSKENQRSKRKRSKENQRAIDANRKVKLSTQLKLGQHSELGQQSELGQPLELGQPERQSWSRNFTTDEKLIINDGVAVLGYDQCHSCCVPTISEINASYYNYDHYGAANCNWKEYFIHEPRGPPVDVNVDEYLTRSLDAEKQMPPQLPPEMAEYNYENQMPAADLAKLMGWIMVIMD